MKTHWTEYLICPRCGMRVAGNTRNNQQLRSTQENGLSLHEWVACTSGVLTLARLGI